MQMEHRFWESRVRMLGMLAVFEPEWEVGTTVLDRWMGGVTTLGCGTPDYTPLAYRQLIIIAHCLVHIVQNPVTTWQL